MSIKNNSKKRNLHCILNIQICEYIPNLLIVISFNLYSIKLMRNLYTYVCRIITTHVYKNRIVVIAHSMFNSSNFCITLSYSLDLHVYMKKSKDFKNCHFINPHPVFIISYRKRRK